MKAHKLYQYDPALGPLPLPPGQTGEPTALVLIECPYCPVMVPWQSNGEYRTSLAGRNRRTLRDPDGSVRPLCLSCSWDVTVAEEEAKADRETAWADYERCGSYE